MPTATAAQRRDEAKIVYNAFVAACPTRQLLDTLSDKWVCLILSALVDGPRRHSDLARTIAGVSQKMLTQTLRRLERDGLVTRTVTPSVPVRVEYDLTALGKSLLRSIGPLVAWARSHRDEIAGARGAYDRAFESAAVAAR